MSHRLLTASCCLVIRVSTVVMLSVIVAGRVTASTLLTCSMSTADIVASATSVVVSTGAFAAAASDAATARAVVAPVATSATAALVASGWRLVEIAAGGRVVVDVVKEATLISNAHELETLLKLLNTILVKRIKSVSSIHLQLPLSHLLGFLYLHGVELHLVAVPAAIVVVPACP